MPEAPPAPPPSAPAPAPAAAPAKAPAPARPAAPGNTKPAPVSKPADNLADAYSQLDKMAGPGEAPPPAPKKDAVKPAAKPDDAPLETPATEKGALETPPDKGAQAPDAKPKAGTLREHYDQLKTRYADLEKKLTTLEAERAKPAEDPEKKTLSETLTARDKRLQELEDELRFTNYERSGDYKEKFEAPFVNAFNSGRNKVASLTVATSEGGTRQGTANDFDQLMMITNDDQAAEFATELFGAKAPMVLFHRERVQELNQARNAALDDYRKQGGEREKLRAEAQTKNQKELSQLWQTEASAAVEKYPQWFKAEEGDDQGNALLKAGFEQADAAFGGMVRDPQSGQFVRLAPQEMTKLHAAIRNKAAGFDRLAYKNGKLSARVKELETELGQYKESEPKGGDPKAGKRDNGPASKMDDVVRGLDKYLH